MLTRKEDFCNFKLETYGACQPLTLVTTISWTASKSEAKFLKFISLLLSLFYQLYVINIVMLLTQVYVKFVKISCLVRFIVFVQYTGLFDWFRPNIIHNRNNLHHCSILCSHVHFKLLINFSWTLTCMVNQSLVC